MAARGRKKVLATLRTILRHTGPPPRSAVAEAASTGVADVDDALMRTGGGTETRRWIRGGSSWRSFVLEQYRANKNEKDRSRVKVLRSQAADYALLLTSLAEQQVRYALHALRPSYYALFTHPPRRDHDHCMNSACTFNSACAIWTWGRTCC